jgi:hypothetical protein
MKRLTAIAAVTLSLLLTPMNQSAGLPKPNKPPLVENHQKGEEKSSIKCESRTLRFDGNVIGHRCIKNILVALTDRAVEWRILAPKDGGIDFVIGVRNSEGDSLACNAIAKNGNWVAAGRKDGKLALYRFSVTDEGPKRLETKSGFPQLKKCELRELARGGTPGKGELEVRITTDYDEKPIRLAVKKTE